MSFDDESGYDPTDPKHPDYHERMSDVADDARKREREEGVKGYSDTMPGVPFNPDWANRPGYVEKKDS